MKCQHPAVSEEEGVSLIDQLLTVIDSQTVGQDALVGHNLIFGESPKDGGKIR